MSNSESRRSSLNRVLETIINESYDNPNVNLSDEDLPLTLKHIPVSIAGDGRHSGHLTLSQTSMLHKLEDLVEETEESMSRKNTIEECDINNIKLRNNDVQIENFDGLLSSILTRRRSVPSNLVNYDNVQMTLRRQKSYPKLT
uniref:WGS project CCBQ000000000 data, contig 00015 n=1 Tax=Loa loa TaxID=7209 RepID=A0A1I7VAH6_LOALO